MNDNSSAVLGSTPVGTHLAGAIRADWNAIGLAGDFIARNLATGEQLGFCRGELIPLASVAKVPLALAVLEAGHDGSLDLAQTLTIDPATSSFGATGLATFRYPVTIAAHDLVHQMLVVSDNAAGDALLDLLGLERLNGYLADWGITDIRFRHRFQTMYDCAVGVAGNDFRLALELSIEDDTTRRHRIESLDSTKANVGSAPAVVDLLARIWLDDIARPAATAEVRRLMGKQTSAHRLSSDLQADTIVVASKTGTFLNLRHDVGVVQTDRGDRIVVVALTRSSQRALIQQPVDLAIGAAARRAVETLRSA